MLYIYIIHYTSNTHWNVTTITLDTFFIIRQEHESNYACRQLDIVYISRNTSIEKELYSKDMNI